MTTRGPVLTLKEAARIEGGASLSTLRRRLSELEKLGAVRTDQGWRIPIAALHQLGLIPGTTPPQGVMAPSTTPGDETPVETPEIERLRREVADLRRRAEVAEARAEERGQALTDVRLAFRALEAGSSTNGTSEGSVAPAPTPPADRPKKRRRWWARVKP